MSGKRNRGKQRKGWEINYNSTGAMWTGTWEQENKTFGGNMLRFSSCSGQTMAEDDQKYIIINSGIREGTGLAHIAL